MLIDFWTHDVLPALDAGIEVVDVRTYDLAVRLTRSRHVATDLGLVERGSPFTDRRRGVELIVVLTGAARFDEDGSRSYLGPGDVVRHDLARGGTLAHAGARSAVLTLDWAASSSERDERAYTVERLADADVARLADASGVLRGGAAEEGVSELLAILRVAGARVPDVDAASLREAPRPDLALVRTEISRQLGTLHEHPTIEDLSATLGWNHRRIHRVVTELSRAYRLPWQHWREALWRGRLLHALRLLSTPGATTELVARLAGFRGSSGLCHALGKAGLPSPGTLARAASTNVLERWATIMDQMKGRAPGEDDQPGSFSSSPPPSSRPSSASVSADDIGEPMAHPARSHATTPASSMRSTTRTRAPAISIGRSRPTHISSVAPASIARA